MNNVPFSGNGEKSTLLRRIGALKPFHKFRRKLASAIVGEGSEDGRKTIVESVKTASAFPSMVRIADRILVSYLHFGKAK